MKRCVACGETKPLTEFGRWARGRDGYQPRCSECHRAYRREWAARHPERVLDYNRRWVAQNAEQVRAIQASWRTRNPGKVRATEQRYAESHPETLRAKGRRRYARNPELWRDGARKRKALIRGARGAEPVRRRDIYDRDGGICHLCGEPVAFEDMHLDHIQPVSRGGLHVPENVAVAHPRCNMRKGNRGDFAVIDIILVPNGDRTEPPSNDGSE